MWNIIITLIIICLWVTSGVAFEVNNMPDNLKVPLSYNPLLHCVLWFRAAYYSDYPTNVLDKAYVVECGLVMFAMGLILNRLLHRFY